MIEIRGSIYKGDQKECVMWTSVDALKPIIDALKAQLVNQIDHSEYNEASVTIDSIRRLTDTYCEAIEGGA